MSYLADLVYQERRELLGLLESLPHEAFDAPTLCSGWRVRDVAAHVVSYDQISVGSMLAALLAARLEVGKMNDGLLKKWSGQPVSQVLSAFEASLCLGGAMRCLPRTMALFDVLVHQQDIRRPLNRPRPIPRERLVPVLRYLRGDLVDVGGAWRGRGLRLVATDIGWSAGKGPEVVGPGEALVMALAGRPAALDELDGPGKPIISSRMAANRNPVQAIVRNRLAYRWVLRSGRLTELAERVVRRWTRGTAGVLDMAGLPSFRVTVAGRRSGVPRTVTLQCIEDRDAFLVVGSNWARTQHPAWSANFMAAEEVHVRRGNEQFAASVRLLRGSEREEAWNRVLAIWPNYQIAQDVAVGREFRLFALEPIR